LSNVPPAVDQAAGGARAEIATLSRRYFMSNVLALTLGILFVSFFSVYVGGMFMFSKCKEVDRDRHSQCMS
jgi:hypothetical protein